MFPFSLFSLFLRQVLSGQEPYDPQQDGAAPDEARDHVRRVMDPQIDPGEGDEERQQGGQDGQQGQNGQTGPQQGQTVPGQSGKTQGRGRFSDVQPQSWYAAAVDYCDENGLMSGVSETSFAPASTMSRAMLLVMYLKDIQNMLGEFEV